MLEADFYDVVGKHLLSFILLFIDFPTGDKQQYGRSNKQEERLHCRSDHLLNVSSDHKKNSATIIQYNISFGPPYSLLNIITGNYVDALIKIFH